MGPTGPKGASGLAGAVGPTGPAGTQGPAGAIGPTGPQGLMGPAGPAGAAGADGQSVTGTTLLPGDPTCPKGGSKFTSVSGDTYACNGAPGSTGPIGPPGPTGASGPSLTLLATPSIKEFSFTGTQTFEVILPAGIDTTMTAILANIFVTANASDAQNISLGSGCTSNQKSWVDTRGTEPLLSFGALNRHLANGGQR